MVNTKKVSALHQEESGANVDNFTFPERLQVVSAELLDAQTGNSYQISPASGASDTAELRQSFSTHALKQIRSIKAPVANIVNYGDSTTTGVMGQDGRGQRVNLSSRILKGISDRQRAEHLERVEQARRHIPDPLQFLSDLLSSRLGPEGLQFVDTYLEEDIGADIDADES